MGPMGTIWLGDTERSGMDSSPLIHVGLLWVLCCF